MWQGKRLFNAVHFKNLFVSLLVLLLIYPAIVGTMIANRIFAVIFSWLIFSAGLASSRHSPVRRKATLILGVPTMLVIWLEQFIHVFSIDLLNYLLVTVFFFFVTISLLIHVMRAERVTTDMLVGAGSVYLMLGIAWAFLCSFLEFVIPGSYSAPAGALETGSLNWTAFTYFSFTTLTTLGYGDIVPATTRAQSFAVVEAATGVLFTALLVSRLVGMYIKQGMKK